MGIENKILLGIGACILIVIGGYILFSGDENSSNVKGEPPTLLVNRNETLENEKPSLNETEPVNETATVNVSVNETLNEKINETINETANITIPFSNYTTEEEIKLLYEMVEVKPGQTEPSRLTSGVPEHADLRLKYLKTKDPKYLELLEMFGADTSDLLKEGANESNVMQLVYIKFKHVPPKPEELEILKEMGVEMDFEDCAKSTLSCTAQVPLSKIYEVADLEFIKSVHNAEVITTPTLDKSVPAINANLLHNLSFNGSGIRVAVILILYFLIFNIIKNSIL